VSPAPMPGVRWAGHPSKAYDRVGHIQQSTDTSLPRVPDTCRPDGGSSGSSGRSIR
jgi:hypothetical protein